MTKEEYIKSRCQSCALCDGSDYHRSHCPDIDKIDLAWDACQREMLLHSLAYWHKILDSQGINQVVFVEYIEAMEK